MKEANLLILLLLFYSGSFMVACNGNGGRDADIDTEDIAEVDNDDLPTDDGGINDLPVEDMLVEDMLVEDIPAEEIPVECVAAELTCSSSLTAESTVGLPDMLNNYNCSIADESGGEIVYSFTTAEARTVTIDLAASSSSEDLDLFILTGECDQDTCIHCHDGRGGKHTLSFGAEASVTYYIVVDGWDGAEDTFDISISCNIPEICDNGVDDNENGFIDCWDPGCWYWEDEHCYESDCTDGTDNDVDGETDCADWDCLLDEAAACSGGAGQVGDACDEHSDCASGQCLFEEEFGYPGGYCTVFRLASNCSTLPCPDGSICYGPPTGKPAPVWCLAECPGGDGCRSGYECNSHFMDGYGCHANCTDSSQCVETGYCDTSSGYCTVPPELCTGGTDEDGDTLIDCQDPDCAYNVSCTIETLEGGEDCSSTAALEVPVGERGSIVILGTTTGASDDIESFCAREGPADVDVVYLFTLTAPALIKVYVAGGPDIPLHHFVTVALGVDCPPGEVLCAMRTERYDFHIEAGLGPGTYYVIVEGSSYEGNDFALGLKLEDLP